MSALTRADSERVLSGIDMSLSALDGRTVVVTGSTGLVGRHIAELLLSASQRLGHTVRVVATCRNLERAERIFGPPRPGLDIVRHDVSEPLPNLGPIDYIVHAASPATPKASGSIPVDIARANLLGTMHLADTAREHGAHLTYISTMEIYGIVRPKHEGDDVLLSEDDYGFVDPLDPRSVYPESKRMAESILVAYANQYGVRSDIARLTHTYGPGMASTDDRVQAVFARQAAAGKPIVLKSTGQLARTYTYASDAAAAVLLIMLTAGERSKTTAFNVADEAARTSIRDLARLILRASGQSEDRLRFELDDPDSANWSKIPSGTYVRCDRLKALGWKPQFTLSEGIRRMIADMKNEEGVSAR